MHPTTQGNATIWAVLVMLGIPLWFIAVALLLLLRTRSKVLQIPGSFACKVRIAPSTGSSFPRDSSRAEWVHDVLVVHGGSPFLVRTTAYGVTAVTSMDVPAGAESRLARVADPVAVRVTTDSGMELELVCAASDEAVARGPFAARPAAG